MLQTLFSRGYRHGKRSTIASIRTIALDIVVQKQPQQCRSFISLPKLPNLPNLLKPLTSSRQYKDRILVKYSQQEFYELVANVDDYQNFLPWCTYSKMSKPSPDNTVEPDPALSQLGIGFNSVQERYVSTVTCQEPWTVRAVSYDSKLFKELATTWRFTPNIPKASTLEATLDHELQERHDYPSCWVDFEIQFEFASPVHASMSSLFFDQVSKEMLKAFIKRAETLFGPR
ncbi:hypothetical protein BCR41DRAFT_330521 [Lobosporangium transversale]|uniref:Coenzyme Q-binding protein COQ10 START domain-containing protein n=1 Tax=Lobosporangium transversale TaxID=64571 RepID=A0A1Y2H399_9FUNG|nr:hypothetical protein BCR41DRAFT_330521 [Lobosporangium transversale]ORZ29006.1 hypothetical protein BCR41DRAFT_330521 [Lobosporangium transversale]|eukprot:XP_021886679.1 hypothetical protein BCR41DRAFT_330521 [Lobosporangium transversale]